MYQWTALEAAEVYWAVLDTNEYNTMHNAIQYNAYQYNTTQQSITELNKQ